MIAVLGSRILVLGESLDKLTSSTIVLLNNQAPMRHGEIVHAGPDCENLRRGDVAMFHENAGHAIVIDETTYIVIHEDDVLAYSPDITEMHMAEDPQVKALREATEDLEREIERAKTLTDHLKRQNDLVEGRETRDLPEVATIPVIDEDGGQIKT